MVFQRIKFCLIRNIYISFFILRVLSFFLYFFLYCLSKLQVRKIAKSQKTKDKTRFYFVCSEYSSKNNYAKSQSIVYNTSSYMWNPCNKTTEPALNSSNLELFDWPTIESPGTELTATTALNTQVSIKNVLFLLNWKLNLFFQNDS